MEQKWIEVETTIDTVNWKGKPIQVQKVKAYKDPKTGEFLVYPSEVSKAMINQMTEEIGIHPRDAATLLMLCVKPGNFNEGDIFYKYHLQKMMFYLWKNLEKSFLDAVPIDKFIGAANGPIPQNMNDDLGRLEQYGLIRTKYQKWKEESTNTIQTSKRIILTSKGSEVAKEICRNIPEPFKRTALAVKKKIYPKNPDEVRHLVHKEFPEYTDTYIKNDIE